MQRDTTLCKVVVQKPKQKALIFPAVKPREFTVGQGMSCSYTVESSVFDARHYLLKQRHGQLYLMVPVGVACEFASHQTKERVNLETLAALHLAEKIGGTYAVPFQPGAVALLKVDDTTIGVEFTKGPERKAQEDLPLELRFPPLSPSDRVFLVVLLASLCFSFFSVWRLRMMDVHSQGNIEAIEDRYAKLILETPAIMKDLYVPETIQEVKPEEKEAPEPDKAKAKPSAPKPAAKGPKGDGGGVEKKGLLAYLGGSAGAKDVLGSKDLKNVLQGVGVLTTKRPTGQKMPGAAIGFRESSGVDDLVAGVAARAGGAGTGTGGGLGSGFGKRGTSVGNPFDVSGSGSQHRLRSYQEIDKVIRQHLEGIRYLYERYLRTEPLLQGRVTLKFTISAEGAITQVSVVSASLNNVAFHEELMKRVRLWKFPAINAGSGAVSVVYPFTFLPKRN